MRDPSSQTRDGTCALCSTSVSLNHWTAQEVPTVSLLHLKKFNSFYLKSYSQYLNFSDCLNFFSLGLFELGSK